MGKMLSAWARCKKCEGSRRKNICLFVKNKIDLTKNNFPLKENSQGPKVKRIAFSIRFFFQKLLLTLFFSLLCQKITKKLCALLSVL
jgi:hypothetical protein